MKYLLLVRYGLYDQNGHLNEGGVKQMKECGQRIRSELSVGSVKVVSAAVSRAIESAEYLALTVDCKDVLTEYPQLYAEDEKPIIDVAEASRVLEEAGVESDVLIAVVSREYIESLPNYLNAFNEKDVFLDRGRALVIDWETKRVLKTI
jgi:phosphohistidine phosphatase SixA